MDAHFSRFGYDAHIRTFDDVDDSDDVSQAETPPASLRAKRRESGTEENMAEPLRLFNVPIVRQYFYKGVLWRASDNQEVQSFELFVDLLYVGIIGINGDTAADTADGTSLLHFIIVFTISWKIWNDIALLISWFKNEDLFQRLSILLLLAVLFGLTTNLENAFNGTYPTIIGFYIAARVFMSLYLALVAWLVPMVRPIMSFYTITSLLGVASWIISIQVAWPRQLIPIWIGIFFDIAGPTIWIFGRAVMGWTMKEGTARFDKIFEVTPAMNIEHRVERTGAFVTLIFGYTVFSILYQSTVNGVDGFFGKGILGLMQCFFFNWIYFEFDNDNIVTHAIRRAKWSAFTFSMGHLPLIMSFVLSGGALARLVVADDCHDTDIEDLTDDFQARSAAVIKPGIRWFYCGGLGLSLIFMTAIAAAHLHKENKFRSLRKRNRLLFRVAAGVVIICLSVADSLNSLELIGTVTAIISAVLIVELWAIMTTVEQLFKFSSRTRYVGMCPKKHFKKLAEGKVDLESDKINEDAREAGLILAPV